MNNGNNDKKIIHLNPKWFSGDSVKTRKRRPTAAAADDHDAPAPVSPMLKQKILMRRIKENKLQQLENLTQRSATTPIIPRLAQPPPKDDDFVDSMDFLQNLSSIKTLDREKEIYEKNKQKRRDELYNRTIHNPYRLKNHNIITPTNDFLVDINTPDELTTAAANTSHFNSLDTVIPTYSVDKAVPYGVLRNGIKPTYRDWKRATPSLHGGSTGGNSGTTIPTARLLAQKKIQMLREKLRTTQRGADYPLDLTNGGDRGGDHKDSAPTPSSNGIMFDSNPPTTFETIYPSEGLPTTATATTYTPPATTNGAPFKKIIKKTFKQKYTLGRSKVKKSIAVLIKNSTIRRNVVDAHKKLKSQPLADVKRYLREHNLIKVGTDAPNDVLRQLYENSVLSGDVVNINGGTLLHNFTNSKAGEHVIDGLEPIEIEDLFKDHDEHE